MKSRGSIKRKNFGLSSNQGRCKEDTLMEDYNNWFWESKSKKKLKEDQKRAEIERMRAETAAMQQIISEPDENQDQRIDAGKVLLIGGLILLVGIGAYAIFNKKKADKAIVEGTLKAQDLMV